MTGNHVIWSLITPGYSLPGAIQLQSICKHGLVQSITPVRPQQALGVQPLKHTQQQIGGRGFVAPGQQHNELQSPQRVQRGVKQLQPAAFLGFDDQASSQQLQQDVLPVIHQGSAQTGSLRSNAASLLIQQQRQPQLPQWQVVTCSVQDVTAEAKLGASHDSSQEEIASSDGLVDDSKHSSNQQHTPAAQPPALNQLIAAAKHKQPITSDEVDYLMQEVQLLLPQLPLYQLAYAAWAAAELSQQRVVSLEWLQQLLTSAEQHFQQPSSVVDETAVATLLQALVKLEQQPSKEWLATCCASLAVDHWHSPRALSTIAACLPQLGHVPDSDFCSKFYQASAAQLPVFPAISTARMLHGVVAWHQLQQQQQEEEEGDPHQLQTQAVAESWLRPVLQQLCASSSQLKPAEISMVLQAMQRLQQQAASGNQLQDTLQLLPAPGQQPETLLQQVGQQLLQALLAAVLQRLPKFKSKDMTVMLFAVSSLAQQRVDEPEQHTEQRPAVSWTWLQRVLNATQLQQLDPRGQATCLAAAAVLIKPHLRLQQQRLGNQGQVAAPAAQAPLQLQEQQSSPAEPRLVKPLQRWLQFQQQQVALEQQPQQPPAGVHGTAATSLGIVPPTSLLASRSGARDIINSFWQQWLSRFYQQSQADLAEYSCEDLTVSLCAFASLQQVPPVAWYESMLDAVQQQLPIMSPGQASGIAWALGTMAMLPSQHDGSVSLVPASTWMQRLYPAVTRLQQQEGTAVQLVGRGEGSVSYSMQSCSAAELVRLLWAAGVCDYDLGEAWWSAAEAHLLSLVAAGTGTGDSRITSSASASTTFQPRQQAVLPVLLLCLVAQAYAAAGRLVPAPVSEQLFLSPAVLQEHLASAPISTIAAFLKSLRQCHCVPPAHWLQQLASGLQQRLVHLQPQELLQLLDSLAASGFSLQLQQTAQQMPQAQQNQVSKGVTPTSWDVTGCSRWAAACLAATQHKMQHMSASDVSFLMWTLVKLQLKPPAPWLEAALVRLQAGFIDATPSSLGLAITALSKLSYMPSSDWIGGFLMATHRRAAAMAADPSSDRVMLARFILMTLWGLADLQVQSLSPKWLKLMLLTVHRQLPFLQPQHSLALLQVLARLKCRPSPRFLQSLLDHIGDCSKCSSTELVKVVYAAASLRWQPNRSWCRMFVAASASKLADMNPQGLALVHWSLAVMQLTPPNAWKSAAVAAVMDRVDQLNAADLSMVLWSWGKLMVHLTPRQEPSRGQQRALREQWKQWLQQRWQQQLQEQLEGRQQEQQQPGWRRQWLQQQWQEWKEQLNRQQEQQQMQSRPTQSSVTLQDGQVVADKLLAAARSLQGSYSMASLGYLLVGVAKMQLRPSQEWLHAIVTGGSAEKLSVLNGLQLQQLVWALAKLGYRAQRQWLDNVSVLLEVAWLESDYIRHSATAAMSRLQQLAVVSPASDAA